MRRGLVVGRWPAAGPEREFTWSLLVGIPLLRCGSKLGPMLQEVIVKPQQFLLRFFNVLLRLPDQCGQFLAGLLHIRSEPFQIALPPQNPKQDSDDCDPNPNFSQITHKFFVSNTIFQMAEREGFEPPSAVKPKRFSRPPQ